jgi:hypothetical protein
MNIAEKLRAAYQDDTDPLCWSAADQIERLRATVNNMYRLMAIEREQNNCTIHRALVQSVVAQHGLFGIAVKDDPIAKQWQALEAERRLVEQEIRDAMK